MKEIIWRKISSTPYFLARRVPGPSAVSGHPEGELASFSWCSTNIRLLLLGGYRFWKCIALFVAFPVIGVLMANVYMGQQDPKAHERVPFVKYEFLRRRTKRFPWGEGNKSLFHNPHTNPLPEGYEDDEED